MPNEVELAHATVFSVNDDGTAHITAHTANYRLLDGIRDWLDHGLVLPESVIEATENYRAESDPCGRFLALCVRPALGQRVQSSELYRVSASQSGIYARGNGATPASGRRVSRPSSN